MVVNQNKVQLTHLHIKNFRCFVDTHVDLDNNIVLIQGSNGSGKTSVLEALHYLCYLRSFRTHSPRELINSGHEGFFIKASFNSYSLEQNMQHEVQVGFAGKKRLVKVDQKAVSSYKDLMHYYRIITLTEDDLGLISSGPEQRRAFLDTAILLDDPEFITIIRNFRAIVDNRNAMLAVGVKDMDSYSLWTQQLWHASRIIQDRRQGMLASIEQATNQILSTHFNNQISVTFKYVPKRVTLDSTWQMMIDCQDQLLHDESRFGRSLFGAHLDDIIIKFQDKNSRTFASRGQQKLIVLLMKIALITHGIGQRGTPAFLLDDFMTDFDEDRGQMLLEILSGLGCQLIFTSPAKQGFLEQKLIEKGAQHIKLTP
jgi:DNA replication and repair protein RecF